MNCTFKIISSIRFLLILSIGTLFSSTTSALPCSLGPIVSSCSQYDWTSGDITIASGITISGGIVWTEFDAMHVNAPVGTLTVNNGGSITSAMGWGLFAYDSATINSISNNGLISGGSNAIGNAGIIGLGASYGIYNTGIMTGGITNIGVITGSIAGVYNSGTIDFLDTGSGQLASIINRGTLGGGGFHYIGLSNTGTALKIYGNSAQVLDDVILYGTGSSVIIGDNSNTAQFTTSANFGGSGSGTLTYLDNFSVGLGSTLTTHNSLDIYTYIFNNAGTVNVPTGTSATFLHDSSNLINSGTITGDKGIENSGLNVTITNYGTIRSGSGLSDFTIYNTGTITSLTNYGVISAGGSSVDGTIFNTGTITSLTNYGVISGGSYGIKNNNGSIITLNNAQGGDGSTAITTALTLSGDLSPNLVPENYNIIITSSKHYGQLVIPDHYVTEPNIKFGIYTGLPLSKGVLSGTYTGALQGFTNPGNLNTSGSYGTQKWTLSKEAGDSGIYDLTIIGSSLEDQARQLRSAFNTQTVAANFALNYDCNLFDSKNLCISAGGKYTNIDNPNTSNSAAVAVLGYKVFPTLRIGAYLDQNLKTNTPSIIRIGNQTPLMGLYAVWNKQEDQLGYQLRLANTYQDQNITLTTAAGNGTSNLNSQSYLAELSYAFQASDKLIARPYFGLRNTTLKQDNYVDSNNLNYSTLRDRSGSALMGVKLNYQISDKLTALGSAGIEQDFYHKVDNYQAKDIDPVAFNSNIKRTRPVISAGAFYDVTKTQRASVMVNYQQLPFQSTGSATAYVNYMIGF